MGEKPHQNLIAPLNAFARLLRWTGLYQRGRRNAADVRVTRHQVLSPSLPPAFDGYSILFISDFHLDTQPEIVARATALAKGLPVDAVILGGDYQSFGRPDAEQAGLLLKPLIQVLAPPDGIFAILGNHDEHSMVPVLEGLGVRVLINEWAELCRGDQRIHLLGLDDVHCFYRPETEAVLKTGNGSFRIAIVHSADLATSAAAAQFDLYLSGHTHGGQIALPGGRPIYSALDSHRALASGWWTWRGMRGYTSCGLGAGHPAVRFNTRGELALITLVKAQ